VATDYAPLRGVLFFVAAITIAAAGLIRVFAWSYVKDLIAAGWSITQGRVEFGNVVEQRVRYVSYFVATIHYSYSVNNEYYSGAFEKVFLRESSADRFVASLKGQMIFIRSNPRRPERSALLQHDQPGGFPA
jgi:hypothetical protein